MKQHNYTVDDVIRMLKDKRITQDKLNAIAVFVWRLLTR